MKTKMKGKCTDSGMRVKQAQVAAAKKTKNGDYAKQLKKEETGMY